MFCQGGDYREKILWRETGFVSERLREILFTGVLQPAPLIFITTALFMGPHYWLLKPIMFFDINTAGIRSQLRCITSPCVCNCSLIWETHLLLVIVHLIQLILLWSNPLLLEYILFIYYISPLPFLRAELMAPSLLPLVYRHNNPVREVRLTDGDWPNGLHSREGRFEPRSPRCKYDTKFQRCKRINTANPATARYSQHLLLTKIQKCSLNLWTRMNCRQMR